MDAFSLIQEFFTHMACASCHEHFEPDSIQLIRNEDDIYVVNVHCHQCDTPNGVAMVGVGEVEADGEPGRFDFEYGVDATGPVYEDPELTHSELIRLAEFEPVTDDDVIEAHRFFQDLDKNWMSQIPEELKEGALTCPGPDVSHEE